MKRFLRLLIAPLLLFSNLSGADTSTPATASPVTSSKAFIGERHILTSTVLEQERVIEVHLPDNYQITSEQVRYPVIYLLDGEYLFHPLSGAVQHLSASSLMPESIVIAVHNAVEAPEKIGDVLTEKRIDVVPELYHQKELAGWGAHLGEQHLAFMQQELIPFVQSRYRTNGFRTLVGLSPTATFTLYTAWQNPDLFNAYIAINHWPLSLQDKDGKQVIDNLHKAFSNFSGQTKKYLYLAEREGLDGSDPSVMEEYREMESRLKDIPDSHLVFRAEILPGYAYNNTLNAFISAMQMMYPREVWEFKFRDFKSDAAGQSLANLQQHYATLSHNYGFEIYPKLRKWWATGDDLIALAARTQDKIAILEYALRIYANSANAHTLLADAYEQSQQYARALPLRHKAVDLAARHHNPRLAVFKRKLQHLQSRLATTSIHTE